MLLPMSSVNKHGKLSKEIRLKSKLYGNFKAIVAKEHPKNCIISLPGKSKVLGASIRQKRSDNDTERLFDKPQ
jgi:hypothetical protein